MTHARNPRLTDKVEEWLGLDDPTHERDARPLARGARGPEAPRWLWWVVVLLACLLLGCLSFLVTLRLTGYTG